jgi:hypothetical protein
MVTEKMLQCQAITLEIQFTGPKIVKHNKQTD